MTKNIRSVRRKKEEEEERKKEFLHPFLAKFKKS